MSLFALKKKKACEDMYTHIYSVNAYRMDFINSD